MPTYIYDKCTVVVLDGISSATAGTQTTHAHGNPNGLGIPDSITFISKNQNGFAYQGAEPDGTNIYVKASIASLNFRAIIYWYRAV